MVVELGAVLLVKLNGQMLSAGTNELYAKGLVKLTLDLENYLKHYLSQHS